MNRKQCFLDLDGVLADFHGGAYRLHNITNPYTNPAHLGSYHIENMVGMSRTKFYGPMGADFWANLEPTAECFDIVRLAEEIFGPENVGIITKPILTPGCYDGKLAWVNRYLPQYANRMSASGAKAFFSAKPWAWLVDDAETNIDEWSTAGGNVVPVPRPWNRWYAQPTWPSVEAGLRGAALSLDDFKVVGK